MNEVLQRKRKRLFTFVLFLLIEECHSKSWEMSSIKTKSGNAMRVFHNNIYLIVNIFFTRFFCKSSTRLTLSEFAKTRFTREYEWSYIHHPGNQELVNKTIANVFDENAAKFGDKEGLVSVAQNKRLTYAELKESADNLAVGLLALGLEPGDRIGLLGPNTYQWIIGQIATAKAGLILAHVNPVLQPQELNFSFNLSGMKALICDEKLLTLVDYYKVLNSFMPEIANSKPGQLNSKSVPELRHIIIMSDKAPP